MDHLHAIESVCRSLPDDITIKILSYYETPYWKDGYAFKLAFMLRGINYPFIPYSCHKCNCDYIITHNGWTECLKYQTCKCTLDRPIFITHHDLALLYRLNGYTVRQNIGSYFEQPYTSTNTLYYHDSTWTRDCTVDKCAVIECGNRAPRGFSHLCYKHSFERYSGKPNPNSKGSKYYNFECKYTEINTINGDITWRECGIQKYFLEWCRPHYIMLQKRFTLGNQN